MYTIFSDIFIVIHIRYSLIKEDISKHIQIYLNIQVLLCKLLYTLLSHLYIGWQIFAREINGFSCTNQPRHNILKMLYLTENMFRMVTFDFLVTQTRKEVITLYISKGGLEIKF